jgi:tRNA G18 (ribose-2'-O)-methylase SpoU
VLVATRRAGEIAPIVPPDVPLYVVPDALIHDIIGFRFHQGVIACGLRLAETALSELTSRLEPRATLVICPDLNNTENLGSLIRIAAGFGAQAMILGPQSCDAFFRQSIRVSMGTVFSLPIVRSDDLQRDLQMLRDDFGFELIATVLDPAAEPLARAARSDRIGILFGNEAHGLDAAWLAACTRRVTIPMHHNTDSLNVAVAAGVVMYHFTSLAGDL